MNSQRSIERQGSSHSPRPNSRAICAAEGGDPRANTVTGLITQAQIPPQVAQGIEAEAFDEIVRAIRAGATYANVHSALHPPGEIRGHVDPRSGHRHH